MKKLLILLTLFTGIAKAEIVELKCSYQITYDGRETTYEHDFSIDTKLKRFYEYETVYVLEIRPHQYVAYPMFLFTKDELLLVEKGIFPQGNHDFIINRENLHYYGRGLSPSRASGGKCKVVKRSRII